MRYLFASITICLLAGFTGAQTKIDSFPFIPDDDVVARLDNLHVEMLKHPDSTAHIILYKNKEMPLGTYLRRFYGIERMWKLRDLPSQKLVMHAGDGSDALLHELWLIRNGERFEPKEFSIKQSLEEKITQKRVFDSQCIDCSPAVPLNQWIFGEGLDYFGKALQANPTATAEVVIGTGALFLTDSTRRRTKLRNDIYSTLEKKYGVHRSRIALRFIKPSDFAYLYIVPKPAPRRSKAL